MTQKGVVVSCVARIIMIVLNVLRRCALSAIRWAIKPENALKLKLFSVPNATQLDIRRPDV